MKFYFKILYQIDNTFYLFTFWCKNLKSPYFTILDAICLWNSGPKPANFPGCLYDKQNFAQIFGITLFSFLVRVFTFSLFYFFRWRQITARCLMWALKGSVTQRPTSLEAGLHPPKKTKTNQLHSWRVVNPVGRTMAIFIIFFAYKVSTWFFFTTTLALLRLLFLCWGFIFYLFQVCS